MLAISCDSLLAFDIIANRGTDGQPISCVSLTRLLSYGTDRSSVYPTG